LQEATEFDENLFPPDTRALNPEEAALQDASGALLRKALEELPVNFREVLVLRELEGMSYKEIAEITEMPVGTVMSSLSRARDRLRQALTSPVNETRPEGHGQSRPQVRVSLNNRRLPLRRAFLRE